MKKLVLLVLGLFLFIPVVVKADAGPPEVRSYKVVPKSSSGADYYDYDLKKIGKIKNKEVIEIYMEVTIKNVNYGFFAQSDREGYVKLDDFKVVKSKNDQDAAIYIGKVFSKKDLTVYEGPSYSYEKTGEELEYDDDIYVSDFVENSTWIYVEKDNIKGYVNAENGAIGILNNAKRMEMKTGKVYDKSYELDGWSFGIMVKTDKGYKKLDRGTYAYETSYESPFRLTNNVNVYSSTDYENAEVVGTLYRWNEITPIWNYDNYDQSGFYVETESFKGWISSNDAYDSVDNFDGLYGYERDKYALADKPTPENPNPAPKKANDKVNKIVLISLVGGAALVLTSIVLFVLINKKKKVQE